MSTAARLGMLPSSFLRSIVLALVALVALDSCASDGKPRSVELAAQTANAMNGTTRGIEGMTPSLRAA